MKMTKAQTLLKIHLKELGIPTIPEFRFCVGRRWRFDLFSESEGLAFEVNGGKWSGGHRRGKQIEEENEKLNTAQMMGYRVLQFTNEQVLEGRAKKFLKEWIKS